MANTSPFEKDSSGSESGSNSQSDMGSFVKTDSADVQRQCSPKENFPNINIGGSRENENATLNSTTDAGEESKRLKRRRKRKIDSLTMSAIKQHVCTPICEAAKSIGVSRSTLNRFCRENGLRWPKPKHSKKTNHATGPKLSQEVMVKATYKLDMIKFRFPTSSGLLELKNEVAKRLNLKGGFNIKYKDEDNDLILIACDDDLHNLPEFLASNTNTSIKLFVHSLTMSAVEQHVGKPVSQAARSFGVSRSSLKCSCRENQSKKFNHATEPNLSQEVMVEATYKRDMIYFRFPTSSGLLELKNEVAKRLNLKGEVNIKYRDEENDLLLITCDDDLHNLPAFLASNTNTSVKLVVDSLTMSVVEQHVHKILSRAAQSFGVSKSTLKCFCREKGKHSCPKANHSKIFNHATDPKLSREVTVKATFKHNMIKFQFPTSSGLLELKNEVAKRLNLKGEFNIKYKDEDNDLILIPCDDDLHNLPEFLTGNTNTSVRLLCQVGF